MATLAWLLLTQADSRVKSAGTIIAMFLRTPHVLDYDTVALAPALAFLIAQGVEEGCAPFQKSLPAGVDAAPILVRAAAGALRPPLGTILILPLFAPTSRRARALQLLQSRPEAGSSEGQFEANSTKIFAAP
jgi:alpha-1,2-mannosyltransferase